MDRREFLKKAALAGVAGTGILKAMGEGTAVAAAGPGAVVNNSSDLIVAQGGEPAALLAAALKAYGGLGKLVKPGNTVMIKANFSWNGPPERACNTNPDLLYALVKACKSAGAKKVVVADLAIDYYAMALQNSGIEKAVKAAGGEIKNFSAYDEKASPLFKVQNGPLKGYVFFAEALRADCLINVPIAKSHFATPMTCALKSVMGLTPQRNSVHYDPIGLEKAIVEMNKIVKYHLHLIDAYRVLKTNGPQGPGEVFLAKQLILTHDPVAGDTYAAGLLGLDPRKVPHIQGAATAGLGAADPGKVKITRVNV